MRRPGSRPGPAAVCRDPGMEGIDVSESTIGHGWMCRELDAVLDSWREGDVRLGPAGESPRGPVDHSAAVEIAARWRCSMGPDGGIRRKDHIAFRGLECLTIDEGSPAEPPRRWPDGQVTGIYLFILTEGFGSGVPTDLSSVLLSIWLSRRDREWKLRQPRGGSSCGSRFIVRIHAPQIARSGAVTVEIAPDEDAIEAYIKLAASCPDHWDALKWAATMLRLRDQPRGKALSDWVIDALNGNAKRPDGRGAAKAPAMLLRDAAIIGAVGDLERCGIPPTRHRDPCSVTGIRRRRNAAEYLSGCAIVAEVFGMKATAVENVWRSVRKQSANCSRTRSR